GGQSIVARYRTRTGGIEFDTLRIPDGTLPALIRAILDRTDQNLVTDILDAEQTRHADRRSRRMAAMGISLPPDHPLATPIAHLDERGEPGEPGRPTPPQG
ncbi:hypothetical protein, partial [Streptomyces sp. SID3343]|uniref:hypothetical protein n=1 Tax=Streptomyces sp. SID3343 TaxID=2690260 RepID=UPI0013BFFA22